ncbi:MCE family protein [Nocardioides terrisoli]|uniref:MCE family protein n=1 Tax=Nocardioides terrisoli TaxID=3388267 RepID=UPI00287BA476|nr:MCE family protein [Nocardioides marmorisolisilvae]
MTRRTPRRAVASRPRAHWTLVILAAVGALALSGCGFHGAYDLPLPGKVVSSSDGYQVTADFNDVVNVVPRTLVMANDVPVGQVDSVRRVGWHARVTMTVRKDIVLPSNAEADVRQTSLLGEKYIALLKPPGASVAKDGRLTDGAFIPLSRTTRNPEVEEVLGALSFLLSGGGVGQLKTISAELNKMMDGRQSDIRDLLSQVDALATSLDGQKDDIISAMESINRLTATLNREKKTVGAAIDSFGPALKVLNQQHGALMKMLRSLDELGRVGTRVIHRSKANIVGTLRHLAPTLRRLADAGNSLPRGVMMMASFPFPKEAASLAKGDYSNALFAMDFDLNKVLSAALKGGDTGLPNVSQLCAVYAGQESCGQLMSALCSALKVNLFCAPVPASSASTTTSGTPRRIRTHAKARSNPLKGIDLGGLGLGSGSSSGGLLGGLGLGSSAPSGGLLGLLGGGR